MSINATTSQEYEQVLVNIVRVLPPNRAEQLIDFARFLEAQILNEELIREETQADMEADNTRWETLLATDESQTLLKKLANEALEEHRSGKTRPLAFDDEGRITPG